MLQKTPQYNNDNDNNNDQQLTPELAIATLVQCDGNRLLAAERLSRALTIKITPQDLTSIITGDPLGSDSLTAQLRLSTLLQTYELLSKLLLALTNTLADLTPRELSSATSNILNIFTQLTSASTSLTSNVNVTEVVLKMLPPEARQAVIELTQPTQSNGSNHE